LPYIALPVILFASINSQLEYASDDAIRCLSMFMAAIIIFLQKESKWLIRSMIACGNIHLIMQIAGIIAEDEKMSISTIFPMANEIMFFYMMVMFCAVFAYFKENNALWKKYAIAIGILTFIAIIVGDIVHTKELAIGGEHALGIWLGLICGTLFTAMLYIWKKFELPKKIMLGFSAIIFSIIMSVSIIVVNYDFFSLDARSEISSRLDNWRAGWNIVKEKPLGVGLGAYGANVMQRWPALENSHQTLGSVTYDSAHNQFLQMLTETGWLGWLFYSALFALPWIVAVSRYLNTGQMHFLFIAGTLAAICSVMVVAEAISQFAFIQIIHWGWLVYCVKALRFQKQIIIRPYVRNLILIVLIPMLIFLFYDRGKQLYSVYLTPLERDGLAPLGRALEIHPKNSEALSFAWSLHLYHKDYEKAFKTLEAIEEIAGYFWPLAQARATIYYEMGDLEKACEAAKFPFERYLDEWTLDLKEKLNCGNN